MNPGVLDRVHVDHFEMCLSVVCLLFSLLERDDKDAVSNQPSLDVAFSDLWACIL